MAKLPLPYKWREIVKQALELQGFTLTPKQISDIKQGKYIDEVLTKKVMEQVKLLSTEYRKKKNRIARLTAKKK
jgi:hypothetical protein